MEEILPCHECHAHGDLEEKVDKAVEKGESAMSNNKEEHTKILNSLNIMASNIKWMSIIGKWILGTMLGYFIALGLYIFTIDYASTDDVISIQKSIKEGEILHYFNELNIERINVKLETIIENTKDKK